MGSAPSFRRLLWLNWVLQVAHALSLSAEDLKPPVISDGGAARVVTGLCGIAGRVSPPGALSSVEPVTEKNLTGSHNSF